MEKTLIFDTHEVVKKFIGSGFTEEQAEIVIREQKKIIENNLANKQDIEEIKKEQLEIKREISEINQKTELIQKEQFEIKKDIEFFKKEIAKIHLTTEVIKKDIEVIKKEIDLMGQKIVNKMYIGIVSCLGAFITIMKILELFQIKLRTVFFS